MARKRKKLRRNPKRGQLWTPEETRLLEDLYRRASDEDLLQALPGRKIASIRQRASRLKIKRARKYPGSDRRTLTKPQAAKLLGIPLRTFQNYTKQIPHDITLRGKHLFDPVELKEWYTSQVEKGRIKDRERALVPSKEGAKMLRDILAQLPIDGQELAKNLKIKPTTFRNYLEARNKGIPVSVIAEAERFLFDYQYGSKIITSFLPAVKTGEELRTIKEQLGLTKKKFAEKLKLSEGTLSRYLYPVEGRDKLVNASVLVKARNLLKAGGAKKFPSKEQLLEAVQTHKGIRKRITKALGITDTNLTFLAKRYGLEDQVRGLTISSWMTKKELVRLLNEFKGNKARIARELGVSASVIHKLLRLAGLH